MTFMMGGTLTVLVPAVVRPDLGTAGWRGLPAGKDRTQRSRCCVRVDGRVDEAVDDFRRAVELAPALAEARRNLGVCSRLDALVVEELEIGS